MLTRCKKCNREIEISKYNTKRICNSCKVKLNRKCPVCGRNKKLCKKSYVCTKLFAIRRFVELFNFDESKIGTVKVFGEFYKLRKRIYDLYHKENKCVEEIKNIFNYKGEVNNFIKFFDYLKINRRSMKDAYDNAILNDRCDVNLVNDKYKTGYHTSWNGETFYYRSSYELEFAKQLDEKKIEYYVEKIKLKYFDSKLNKIRIAISDFYLPATNEIIEIKSMWTFDDVNLKDRAKVFIENGYKFKVLLDKLDLLEYNFNDKKDKIIFSNGYKLSIHNSFCFKLTWCHDRVYVYEFKTRKKKEKNCDILPRAKKRDSELAVKEYLVIERRILLDESGIDLMKFGWIQKISKLWNVSHTQTSRWILKYYPDLEFYERKNFTRKA